MNKQIDDSIPSIKPDRDQVEAYRTNKKASKSSTGPSSTVDTSSTPAKSSGLGIFNSLVLYAAIAGGAYWFYQQDIKGEQALEAAEQRIVELERQLSATDEEMGESTVAMRAKLEGLIEKTDTLWGEMDKLWASAWRKNQSQIKELRSKSIKAENSFKDINANLANSAASLQDLADKQTAATFNIDALAEQLTQAQNIKSEIDALNSKLISLESKSSERDSQQVELATMVQELDTSVKMLIERMQPTSASSSSPATPQG
ncbi:hypothetical protein ACFSJY_09900 [Thalassotalea euphylliae]|uniref:hypothetical protein n=1 Tax=Thalassotalea euphylliae TaxID=1655234 RepID=UPI0036361A04